LLCLTPLAYILVVCLITQGVNIGIIPTTLPDMEVRTSSNTVQMSMIFVWMGLARTIGAMAVGPLFDCVNGMLVLSVCFLLYAATVGQAPTWQSLSAFQSLIAMSAAFDASLSLGKFKL